MVVSWWFNGAFMVVSWWFNGGFMVVSWWFNGGFTEWEGKGHLVMFLFVGFMCNEFLPTSSCS